MRRQSSRISSSESSSRPDRDHHARQSVNEQSVSVDSSLAVMPLGALLADWRTRVLLACSSLPVAVETTYLMMRGEAGNGDAAVAFALLTVTACLLMALTPRLGGWAIVVLWTARCVMPQAVAFSILFPLLMAVTVMAYLRTGPSLLASVIAEIAAAARIWLYPWDTTVLATVCATAALLMVALWIGSSMHGQEQREQERRERAMLLRRLGDQRLAEQLHHSVANDLTTILLLARQARSASEEVTATKMEGSADPEYEPRALSLDDDQLVTLIERTTEESLVKVRRLIAGLDRLTEPAVDTASGRSSTSISSFHGGDDERRHAPAGFSIRSISRFRDSLTTQVGSPSSPTSPISLASLTHEELESLTEGYRAQLRGIGLEGEFLIAGASSVECSEDCREALLSVLREIVGNMMKYANPSGAYCIALTIDNGRATLSASNAVDDTDLSDGTGLSAGTGLLRCRQSALRLGGEFEASLADGLWTGLLVLPLV